MNNDDHIVLVSGGSKACVLCGYHTVLLSEHGYFVVITFKVTERIEQRICITFCVKLEHSSVKLFR